jgi:hypothetical protein
MLFHWRSHCPPHSFRCSTTASTTRQRILEFRLFLHDRLGREPPPPWPSQPHDGRPRGAFSRRIFLFAPRRPVLPYRPAFAACLVLSCSVNVERRGQNLKHEEYCSPSDASYQAGDAKPYVDSLCDRQSPTLAVPFYPVRLGGLRG